MRDLAGPAAYAVFLWWFSTGLVLYLDGLPRRTHRTSMLGASALGVLAVLALAVVRDDTGIGAAYVSFTAGLLIWGWHEMSFLTGWLTGPRRCASRPGRTGWRRFREALDTLLYHEAAIAATAAVLVAITWDAANAVGTWTYLLLWGMRLSAKLNVFLGLPNLPFGFLPEHLRYLETYFVRKPMNLLFPVSVTACTLLAASLVGAALAPDAVRFETVAFALLATLTVLAAIEHWMLVVPLPSEGLWAWGFKSRGPRAHAKEGLGHEPRI